MSTHGRTAGELIESLRYGRLYQICRIHGRKYVAKRVGLRNGNLYCFDKKVTLEATPTSTLKAAVGDFCFVDNGSETWSLWKVINDNE